MSSITISSKQTYKTKTYQKLNSVQVSSEINRCIASLFIYMYEPRDIILKHNKNRSTHRSSSKNKVAHGTTILDVMSQFINLDSNVEDYLIPTQLRFISKFYRENCETITFSGFYSVLNKLHLSDFQKKYPNITFDAILSVIHEDSRYQSLTETKLKQDHLTLLQFSKKKK